MSCISRMSVADSTRSIFGDVRRGRHLDDAELLLLLGVIDEDVEHEAVLLRLGQRIGAFLLDGVLRRQHEERVGQLVPGAADGDLPLLHGFEQGGLRLGRRAVDLVGEDDVGEQRAVQELEQRAGRSSCPPASTSVPVMSRRHQVGRELDAAEAEAERVGQGADHERLGQARHADEQAVAAGEDGDEQLFEDALLADDGLAHLLADAAIAVVEPLDGGQVALDARPGLGGAGGLTTAASSS